MTEALIVLVLAALVLWGAWRVILRLRRGSACCGEHEAAVKRVSVADRNRAHYPYRVRLTLGGMTCENCARRIENALNALPGVWARVDLSARTASVLCKTEPDEALLRETVRSAGYAVTGYEKN